VIAASTLGVATRSAHASPMTTSPEQAYDLGDVESARAVGMAGALNALGVSTTALYLNPANLPMARVYHLEAIGALSPEAGRQSLGLAIADSVLNANHVSGGFSGVWSRIDPDGMHRTWTDVRGSIAMPLGDFVAVGATARWLHVSQSTGVGPFAPAGRTNFTDLASGGTSDSPIFSSLTFDVGATAALGDSVRIGISGHNLTNPGTALAPTTGSAGIGFTSQMFSLEADGMLDFTTWGSTKGRVMAGGELFLADRYAVRAGWRYDAGAKMSSGSLGLGYIDPSWSIEVAARRDFVSDHAGTLGVISLRYFYDVLGTANQGAEPTAD
jgi:hypothetical protein